jgi:hypothetical protein
VRCAATRAYGSFGSDLAASIGNRLHGFAIPPKIVFAKELPILLLKLFNDRQYVGLELLIIW